jgi:hypothetical protein
MFSVLTVKEQVPDSLTRAKNSNKKERRVSKIIQQPVVPKGIDRKKEDKRRFEYQILYLFLSLFIYLCLLRFHLSHVVVTAPIPNTNSRQASSQYRGEQPDLSKHQSGVTLKIQKKNWFAMTESAESDNNNDNSAKKKGEEEEEREREEKQRQLAKMESAIKSSASNEKKPSAITEEKKAALNPFTVQSPKQRRLALEQGKDEEINAITSRAKEQLALEKNRELDRERAIEAEKQKEKSEHVIAEKIVAPPSSVGVTAVVAVSVALPVPPQVVPPPLTIPTV